MAVSQWTFDLLWTPFQLLGPHMGLATFSLFSGLAILFIYRATAPEAALRRLNDRMVGALLDSWYVRDSLWLMLRAQGRIVGLGLRKILLMWKALLVLSVLVLWLLVGLHPYCEWRPFTAGEHAVLTVGGVNGRLLPSTGISVETPPLRVSSRNEQSWRIGLAAQTTAHVQAEAGERSSDIPLVVGSAFVKIMPHGPQYQLSRSARQPHWTVPYPARTWGYCGREMHWVWWFSLFALLGAAFGALLFPGKRHYA